MCVKNWKRKRRKILLLPPLNTYVHFKSTFNFFVWGSPHTHIHTHIFLWTKRMFWKSCLLTELKEHKSPSLTYEWMFNIQFKTIAFKLKYFFACYTDVQIYKYIDRGKSDSMKMFYRIKCHFIILKIFSSFLFSCFFFLFLALLLCFMFLTYFRSQNTFILIKLLFFEIYGVYFVASGTHCHIHNFTVFMLFQ